MLEPRIVVCLLVLDGQLVRTKKFRSPRYLGDPLNAVRIFNEKLVDELVVLDIGAAKNGGSPDLSLISSLAKECAMPLSYGGGVQSADEIERLVELGVEKVIVGSALAGNLSILESASRRVGRQSLTVAIDVVRSDESLASYEVVTRSATCRTGLKPEVWAKRVIECGGGEILLSSVDRDGTRMGFDHALIDLVIHTVDVPLTIVGGAGNYGDLGGAIQAFAGLGVAAGTLFTLQGRFEAVLLKYPSIEEKSEIFYGLS